MEVKKSVPREMESRVSEGCVIATNTSSLSVTEMATALERPERFVMHLETIEQSTQEEPWEKCTLAGVDDLMQGIYRFDRHSPLDEVVFDPLQEDWAASDAKTLTPALYSHLWVPAQGLDLSAHDQRWNKPVLGRQN